MCAGSSARSDLGVGFTWVNRMASRPSLASRLVLPVVGLVLVAVMANVAFAAWWGARRAAAAAGNRRQQVAAALASTRMPLAAPVLAALHQLTGDHYVVWDAAADGPGTATLPLATAADELKRARESGSFVHNGTRYRVGQVKSAGVRPETVLVLSPTRTLTSTTLEAVWPQLAVATATLAVLVPLGLRTTQRLAGRIGAIDHHVGRITEGEFGHRLPAADDPDEIARLVAGVNRMSGTLAAQQDSLVAGERQRLLGQLAAGFAHELRNAITGARLAIDLHRRRCPATATPPAAADESLTVAVRQLDILEEEVRGLLALGKPSSSAPAPVHVGRLLGEVVDLVAPRASHAGVDIAGNGGGDLEIVGQREALRAAVVNLMLNGIDAAGAGGSVRLVAARHDDAVVVAVEDTGPGPAAAVRDSMLEPFVTGKPEGIGLGLAVARTVAEAHGGRLEWSRVGDRTRFAMIVSITPPRSAASPPA